MSDFSLAGMVWAILLILILASFKVGVAAKELGIKDECQMYGSFNIGKVLYDCNIQK